MQRSRWAGSARRRGVRARAPRSRSPRPLIPRGRSRARCRESAADPVVSPPPPARREGRVRHGAQILWPASVPTTREWRLFTSKGLGGARRAASPVILTRAQRAQCSELFCDPRAPACAGRRHGGGAPSASAGQRPAHSASVAGRGFPGQFRRRPAGVRRDRGSVSTATAARGGRPPAIRGHHVVAAALDRQPAGDGRARLDRASTDHVGAALLRVRCARPTRA